MKLPEQLPKQVKIVEVAPRDGLQNEKAVISTQTKIALIDQLADAGVSHIEAASFVSPKWVPQMADSTAVMQGITRFQGTRYSALTPNLQGFEAALAAGVDEVVIFTAASEAFTQKNINCSIAQSVVRFEGVVRAAQAAGLTVRGSISCCLGCPYQGDVPAADVVRVVSSLKDLGCDEIDIADTIGVGTAEQVKRVYAALDNIFPLSKLSGHFHDTYGQALTNIYAALQCGVHIFHSSVAGLGGCPYALGATGNVATEDVLYLMQGLGIETGIDLAKVVKVGDFISQALGRSNQSRVGPALLARNARL
ncbi:MAG: hydroxymethylglutaryl-CoA lyase [Ottowia sp.]|nr:hydroxymethylglutaryl-CoA lyase [Ottowia sp.]